MNDKIKINLKIGGRIIPMNILPENEEIIREAAKQVEMKINAYRGYYTDLEQETILGLTAFDFALSNLKLKERNDTQPYTDKIEELNELLENHLNGTK